MTPNSKEIDTIKKILVGGIYISPRSQYKQESIDHIIETMFYVQTQYEFQVRFLIGGDFNKVNIQDIFESNGALQQICNVNTRNNSTLEFVITDMATLFHPPTIMDPLKQDENTTGKPSDHNVVVVAPRTDINFKIERHKTKIQIRAKPESNKAAFMLDIGTHQWNEVSCIEGSHEKAQAFHETITTKYEHYFPAKTVTLSSLDKPWFTPSLKLKYNKMQNEYFKKGKTELFKKLRKLYRISKKKSFKNHYEDFATELKKAQPGQYYKIAKQIGGFGNKNAGKLIIESLEGLDPQQQVERVAESFALISNEYSPVDLSQLPAYLPAEQAPQLEVYKVYKKIQMQKKTRSTLPIDIHESLCKEAAEFLAEPLTEVMNTCLKEGKYPKIWKWEQVTPVPKTKPNQNPKDLKQVRKIASTSDYSKIFECFLLELILQDISHKLSTRQFGGEKGIGTEHLIIQLIDRIKMALDDPKKIAVILKSYDWSGAFDRLDPTSVAKKLIKLGIRSSIVKILIDFMTDRKMEVKMNGKRSSTHNLVGGGPQGSILGQLLYIIGSDDAAYEEEEDDKFKYVDDLAVTEIVETEDKLIEYNFWQHVASDIGVEQKFLPHNKIKSQSTNDQLSNWTTLNKMKINEAKSKFIIFSNSRQDFTTRLTINRNIMEKTEELLHLGVWINKDLRWDKHISEICKRAYPRIKMLTKLRYAGLPTEDLVEIYCLMIRSLTEYCSSSFHSSLNQRLESKLEAIQKTSLRVILGEMYISHTAALKMCGLSTLSVRRKQKCIQFALKCTKHPTNFTMFPLNPSKDTHFVRKREKYKVNMARTDKYKKSAIPYLQERLNKHCERIAHLEETRRRGAEARRRGAEARRRGPGG